MGSRRPRIRIRWRTRAAAAALIALGALTGCGGSARPSRPSPGLGVDVQGGRAVFVHSCSACHSLVGNESLHKQGGDLLGYNLSRGTLTEFTREMPVRHPLSEAQIHAVVAYVAAAQQRGSAR